MGIKAFLDEMPSLETERLLLRKFDEGDVEAIFAYASNPAVARYTVWTPHQSQADSRAFVDYARELYAREGLGPWAVIERATGTLIGSCQLSLNPAHGRGDLGYAIGQPYWGRGYMTEAVQAILTFGFLRLGLNRIQAMCLPENEGSARVMEKVGMEYEGTLRCYMIIKGQPTDLKIYSILRQEFLKSLPQEKKEQSL